MNNPVMDDTARTVLTCVTPCSLCDSGMELLENHDFTIVSGRVVPGIVVRPNTLLAKTSPVCFSYLARSR
ncbi:MAG: hypothetical protein BWY63_02605 [Chloroflexi bacterium ADurb.Bin360]|nr:MAG: hypothetical protein BWY63_02605 [Chloroflexi bacterium ADurb.Bin360]